MIPKKIEEGTEELTKTTELDDIGLILIAATPEDEDLSFDIFKRHIESYLEFEIPNQRVFRYVPPRDFNGEMLGRSQYKRTENIPRIDPQRTYIIVDDIFEKGTTLKCTINALETRGLKKDNLWFYTADIWNPNSNNPPAYLDKAETFLKFRKENPID